MDIFIPDSETNLYGLLGKTLSHSISPSLHNNGFRDLDINAIYLMLEVGEKDLGEYIHSLKNLGFSGWNVTIPYKEEIIPYLNGFSSLARDAGAVNTVLNRRGRLTGYNTDVIGFQRQIEEAGFAVKGKKAVIIGSGGAARAAAASLIQLDLAEVTFINRTLDNAQNLAEIFKEKEEKMEFSALALEESEYKEALKNADLIINTTPVGMFSHQGDKLIINPEYINEDQFVVDLIYNPLKTELLKEAEKRGAQIGNGLPTLIYQAEASFKLWTKEMPNKKSWKEIGEKAVKETAVKEAAEKEK